MRTLAIGLLLATAAASPALAEIVDVNAISPTGTVKSLAAGTYTISFAEGAYAAWNPWNNVAGCDGAGMNCSNGWAISLGIDFGLGTDTFNHVDGYQYGFKNVPGNNHLYSTAAAALAAAQTGTDLVYAPLATATDASTYSPAAYPISFTLAAAQNVNFFILDYPYGDNGGGVSFALTRLVDGGGVPEPATWGLMILGFGATAGAMRRRRSTAPAMA